ncbi:MAG: hypothetical protein AABX79_01510 [Nanoarchaeota archaeon]
MNFIKKIFLKKADESVHNQFIRFGKGEYRRRAILSLWKTGSIKIKSSFEFANDLVLFAAGLGNISFNGSIWGREQIPGMQETKKGKKIVYNAINLTGSKIKEIAPMVYYFLLNADGPGIKLKIKGKLPKPGKGEDKIDEKFCQLEIDEKYYQAVKEDFFWDIPECKKASIEHTFAIKDIVMPKGETDYAKIREMAKRKGKIIRIANVDGSETRKEIEFEV